MVALSDRARAAIQMGVIKERVKRAGIFQFLVLKVKKVRVGSDEFTELYSEKVLDMPELKRLANEIGLPIEVANGRCFPDGLGAKDFIEA